MPRRQINDGMEIVYGDLSAISSSLEMELYDRVIYELIRRQQNVVFGDSFKVTYVNGTTVAVNLGNGLYFDNTQVDPEPQTRLLRLAASVNEAITTPNASLNRIDIVCIQAARGTVSTQSRNYKDPSSGVVSSTSQIVETDWASNLQVVAGTPSGSPVAPATPSGWVKLAECLVTAVSGIASQSAITDKRPRFQQLSSWGSYTTQVGASYTVDLDDELIICNPSGAQAINLPSASLCGGKKLQIKNISTQTITVTPNGTDVIDGAATQVIATQWTSLSLRCDGGQWYLV